jgi:hypothetical protein
MRKIAPDNPLIILLFIFWFLLLIPWWTLGRLGMGLAFDEGHTTKVYAFVWSIGTYPVVLLIALALALSRKEPRFAFLPLLNALVFCITGLTPPK